MYRLLNVIDIFRYSIVILLCASIVLLRLFLPTHPAFLPFFLNLLTKHNSEEVPEASLAYASVYQTCNMKSCDESNVYLSSLCVCPYKYVSGLGESKEGVKDKE